MMLYLGFFFLAVIALFLITLHLGFRAPRIKEAGTPADFGMAFNEVSIPTVANKQLFGWLLPVDNANETLVILHGWGGNMELMLPIAQPFYKASMNVLLLDARNHGRSDAHSFSSMPRFAEDLACAIDWLQKNHPDRASKVAVLGHSVGAAAVLLAASRRHGSHDIQAVISVSAFAHPEAMMQRYLQSFHLPRFLIQGIMRYVEWVIGHTFATIAPMKTVCAIECPVLIVHGKEDSTVPIDDARTIMANCPESHLSLLEIEDAGHDSVDKIEEHGAKLVQFLHESGFGC